TEDDCINYIKELVIDRTYDGYTTEIKTIYGQLQELLGVKIEPASDEWDRLYNVDFFIKVKGKYLGLQIKPVSQVASIPEIYKERGIQHDTHKKFKDKFGGSVFYIFSYKNGSNKVIANKEVVDEIRNEILRLENNS
ncbi:MAG: MjaI family restriction endonuclease, partial [Ruminiclostridium sp.]|nr:MjaI family restriction endonuclease [Ruminiclostridium sp.]